MDVYAQCLRSRGNVWSPHVLCTQPAFTQQFVLQVPLKSVQARQPSGLRREKLLKLCACEFVPIAGRVV